MSSNKKHYCKYCNAEFTHHSSRYRHEKHTCKMRNDITPEPTQPPPVKIVPKSKTTTRTAKKKLIVEKKPELLVNQLIEHLVKLQQNINEIGQNMREVKNKPTIVNNFNVQIITSDFYTELIKKIGIVDTVDLLVNAAAKNQPLSILKKLYFDDVEPNKYPIAYSGSKNCFRYLNDHNQVVEDHNGNIITDILAKRIQTAMIHATNTLITSSISSNRVDMLYDIYDIGQVQSNLTMIDRSAMKSALVEITNNPSHTLFHGDVNPLILSS